MKLLHNCIIVAMSDCTLYYLPEDADACKIVIAAELSDVAVSLIEIQSRDSGMNITYVTRVHIP